MKVAGVEGSTSVLWCSYQADALLSPEKICVTAKVIGGGMPDYEFRGSMTPLEFKEGSYR
jgi:hypothetical protein